MPRPDWMAAQIVPSIAHAHNTGPRNFTGYVHSPGQHVPVRTHKPVGLVLENLSIKQQTRTTRIISCVDAGATQKPTQRKDPN